MLTMRSRRGGLLVRVVVVVPVQCVIVEFVVNTLLRVARGKRLLILGPIAQNRKKRKPEGKAIVEVEEDEEEVVEKKRAKPARQPAEAPVTATAKTTGSPPSTEVFCVCRQPYQSGVFMIACDLCHEWYHPECIDLTDQQALALDEFTCEKCGANASAESKSSSNIIERKEGKKRKSHKEVEDVDKAKGDGADEGGELADSERGSDSENEKPVDTASLRKDAAPKQAKSHVAIAATTAASVATTAHTHHESEEADKLYCICRRPYSENDFMIACDECEEWYHGDCVGLTQQQSEKLSEWLCPSCNEHGTPQPPNSKAKTELSQKTTDAADVRPPSNQSGAATTKTGNRTVRVASSS